MTPTFEPSTDVIAAGPPVGSTAASLLREAVSRLSERAEGLLQNSESEREDALETLREIERRVEDILGGADPGSLGRPLAESNWDLRLVHLLRQEILRAEIPPADGPAALETLKALEGLLLAATGDDPEDLKARLSQPDAFELLVEVAHDLRSPLTSILFLSEALRGGHSGELSDLQRSQIGLIYSAALGLISIASDIVDLGRREQSWVEQEPEAYSIEALLQSVEEMVRPMAEEKHIELLVSEPHYDRAYGHPMAMSRVLLNLTTNAVKFTDKGFVELGAKRLSERRIEFYVRDTGRGIPPDLRRELFRPMKRRPSRQGHFFSGSGLGLSISRRIIRSIGSELQLETAPDWGSRFFFLVDVPPLG